MEELHGEKFRFTFPDKGFKSVFVDVCPNPIRITGKTLLPDDLSDRQ
jgi:hypothetical protein